MSNSLFAWVNTVLVSPLAANSAAVNLGVDNLKTEIGSPSVAWQTVTGTVDFPGALFTIQPPLLQQTWRAFGLFRTNLTPFATVTFQLWNNRAAPVLVWSGQAFGPEPGYAQAICIADQDYIADFAQIIVSDTANPDGFINVPLCFAGPAWVPQTGLAYDTTLGDDVLVDETVSRGGQEYPVLRWDRRRMELSMTGIRQGEIVGYLESLRGAARRGNNILFVPDITSETMDQEAIYGRVLPTADVGYPYAAVDRRSWRARITERL